jgi:hypothetical protein
MNKPLTVEQLVQKCFKGCNLEFAFYSQAARAARRFVRLENKQKRDKLWKRIDASNERIAACRKTRKETNENRNQK